MEATAKRYMSKQETILVIKLGALGDFIQALGPMAAIRAHHKKAKIILLTTAPYENFAKQSPYFDDIYIDTKPKLFQLGKWLSLKQKLNAIKPDRVYDLQNNDRSCFYFRLLSQKPEWVGIAKGASHRNTSPERTQGHAFEGHKQTLALAGIENIEIDNLSWIQSDITRFSLKEPYILFVPGSSPLHPQKRWPAEHYARLATYLQKLGYQIVMLGTAAEKDVTDKIKTLNAGVIDLNAQTSLFEIIGLAHNAAACIGNDTGPMHMIAPTGCPCITLFSSHSNPKRHYPLGPNTQTLQEDNLGNLAVEQVLNALNIDQENMTGAATTTLH